MKKIKNPTLVCDFNICISVHISEVIFNTWSTVQAGKRGYNPPNCLQEGFKLCSYQLMMSLIKCFDGIKHLLVLHLLFQYTKNLFYKDFNDSKMFLNA